jgi:NMT1-like family
LILLLLPPGTTIPNGFEVIASLNEEKFVLVSHKGNHFEQLKDIGNATINIVNTHDYDERVLRKLFDFFETAEQRNKINIISLDNFLETKILPNRMIYAFFLKSFSSTSHKIFKTRIQKLRDKLDVTEIDLAELADYSYVFFSSIIKKGELSIHPLLPSEDIDTVAAFTYLVARTSVSEEVISRILTFLNASKKLILDKLSGDAFLNVEGISESKNIAFHRGYKKFLNGENEGFFQKNSDTIYISGVALAALFSFVYSHYKKRKRKADESHIGILAVFEDLEKDWHEDLPNEDKQKILNIKKVLSGLIVHRSNKKNILMNSLLGFLVLTNLANALRKRDDSYKDS